MKLVLLRHGNTFAPGDKVVMVGAAQDLPLVASGLEQARRCAAAFTGVHAAALYTSPLRRTRQYADLVGAVVGCAPAEDERLRELDYGAWSGLSDEEIHARGEGEALRSWRERGVWPAAFTDREPEVEARVLAFMNDLAARHRGQTVLVVTSQGVLRYFLKQDPSAFAARAGAGQLGVKTGHGALQSAGRCVLWNVAPEALAAALREG